jgi:putative membrane protein (TIGR04086 family)
MSHENRKPPHKKKHSAEEAASPSWLFLHAAIGAGIALLFATAMLLVGAFLCARSSDPTKMTLPWGLGALYLSALLGGLVTTRQHGSSALLCGTLCGLLLLVFFWIVSIFFSKSDNFSLAVSLILRLLTAIFSIFGAFLGVRRTRKRPRRGK